MCTSRLRLSLICLFTKCFRLNTRFTRCKIVTLRLFHKYIQFISFFFLFVLEFSCFSLIPLNSMGCYFAWFVLFDVNSLFYFCIHWRDMDGCVLLRVGLNEIEMLPYIIRYNCIKRHAKILHFDWYGLNFARTVRWFWWASALIHAKITIKTRTLFFTCTFSLTSLYTAKWLF